MSSITEGLKTEMNDLRSEVSALESRLNGSQAKMEGNYERQQRVVTSIMEQETRDFREGIEATRRELEAQLAAVYARWRCEDGGGPGAISTKLKQP